MASDIFLKINGIPGESTDKEFKDQIEVASYTEGAKLPTTGGSSSGYDITGRAEIKVMTVNKDFDSSSPLLRRALCLASEIPEVVLTLRRTVKEKPTPYMTYKLVKAKVVEVNVTGMGMGSIPTESVMFRFEEIHYDYKLTGDKTGNTSFKYSVKENTPL